MLADLKVLLLVGFSAAIIAAASSWVLPRTNAQHSPATEMPSVKITSQTGLGGHLKLLWLEIDRQGYDVKEINHRSPYPPTPDCHEGLIFQTYIKEDQVDKSSPTIAYSWSIPETYNWICLEMVAVAPNSQTATKLYAALQLVKPKVAITDRPTVEVVGQSTISPHQKSVGTKIISNGYNIKSLGYHTSGLRTSDCHQDLTFQPLSIGNQFDNNPELVYNLVILANGPWLCTTITYVDANGQDVSLYLSTGGDVDHRPAAKFVVANGGDQQAVAPVEPDDTETASVDIGNGNEDAGQTEGSAPPPTRATEANDAETSGSTDDGGQDASQIQNSDSASVDAEAVTSSNSDSASPVIFVIVAVGVAGLVSVLFLSMKRT